MPKTDQTAFLRHGCELMQCECVPAFRASQETSVDRRSQIVLARRAVFRSIWNLGWIEHDEIVSSPRTRVRGLQWAVCSSKSRLKMESSIDSTISKMRYPRNLRRLRHRFAAARRALALNAVPHSGHRWIPVSIVAVKSYLHVGQRFASSGMVAGSSTTRL